MRTAKGIDGIRKFLAEDAKQVGWHVGTRFMQLGYKNLDVATIVDMYDATLIGFTGNGICIELPNESEVEAYHTERVEHYRTMGEDYGDSYRWATDDTRLNFKL